MYVKPITITSIIFCTHLTIICIISSITELLARDSLTCKYAYCLYRLVCTYCKSKCKSLCFLS